MENSSQKNLSKLKGPLEKNNHKRFCTTTYIFQITSINATPISIGNLHLPLHYRVRCPLGRFFSQKMFKRRVLFLSEKKDIFVKIKWSLRRLWPRFLTQKFAANIYKTKYADIMQNVWKSKKGGSVKADFFVWRGFITSWEEKLKIATFTEAPFMVKSDF